MGKSLGVSHGRYPKGNLWSSFNLTIQVVPTHDHWDYNNFLDCKILKNWKNIAVLEMTKLAPQPYSDYIQPSLFSSSTHLSADQMDQAWWDLYDLQHDFWTASKVPTATVLLVDLQACNLPESWVQYFGFDLEKVQQTSALLQYWRYSLPWLSKHGNMNSILYANNLGAYICVKKLWM